MILSLAIRQQSGVVECAYVRSCVIPEVTYFASQLELGPDGIQKYLGIQPLNDDECKLLLDAIPVLTKAISQGEVIDKFEKVVCVCARACVCVLVKNRSIVY